MSRAAKELHHSFRNHVQEGTAFWMKRGVMCCIASVQLLDSSNYDPTR